MINKKVVIVLLAAAFCLPAQVFAGKFRVTPIKVYFDSETKSAVINLINEADEELRVQLEAREWTQDDSGKDQYSETSGLVFFPKVMTIPPLSKRIIRLGLKGKLGAREKTYRLFVQELPARLKSEEGAKIAIAMRFGVPVFVSPSKVEVMAALGDLQVSAGEITMPIVNTGNVHMMINKISLKGFDQSNNEIFQKELNGWYLLNKKTRKYQASIPEETCPKLSSIVIEAMTDKLNLQGKIDVGEFSCRK